MLVFNDDRRFLADKAMESQTIIAQESRVASLKINSLKFAQRTPEIGAEYIKEAMIMAEVAFFAYVSNRSVINDMGWMSVN